MPRPYDAYVEQQKRKAEVLDASIRKDERERIIELLKKEFGEDYYDMGVVGRVVALIKGEYE
jgi:hypothetical protein